VRARIRSCIMSRRQWPQGGEGGGFACRDGRRAVRDAWRKEKAAVRDERNEVLARQLLEYSVELEPGERLIIEVNGREALELARVLVRQATALGAVTFWYYNDLSLQRQFIRYATEEQFRAFADLHLVLMRQCDAWLGVAADDNPFDLADVSPQQLQLHQTLYVKPVHQEVRVKGTKWCILRFPSRSIAQMSEMSQESYEDLYYDVCCLDYAGMSRAMDPLMELMERTDAVHIVAPGTDLTFSIKDIPILKWDGKSNIPDGELMTAPVRESVNGTLTFNTPGLFRGSVFRDVRLDFHEGKIVGASCQGDVKRLNEILDMDEGARYVGEFALGLNPFILHPSRDVLFTEKIAGSFHVAAGNCYDEASNGNHSAIHWDLVQIQRKEYGGGEIYFDGELVRRDGLFVDEELERSFSAEALRGTQAS
jgi:aminopeptidase